MMVAIFTLKPKSEATLKPENLTILELAKVEYGINTIRCCSNSLTASSSEARRPANRRCRRS